MPDLAAELEVKSREARVLRQVSAELNATMDLDEIPAIVLRTMDELFGFRHSMILMLDPGGDTLSVKASRGYDETGIGASAKVGVGVIGVVAKRRRTMRATGLRQQRAYAATVRRQMEAAGRGGELAPAETLPGLPDAESQIAIPLMIQDELIGVFAVESPDPEMLDEGDEVLVGIVANQAASAIHNAQLFHDEAMAKQRLARAHERLKQLNETLEERVRERTAELEAANGELRAAQAQLVQSGKMASLGKLVAGVAHEINNPMASVESSLDTLSRANARLAAMLGNDGVIEREPRISSLLTAIDDLSNVIRDGSERVSGIVRRLRSFAKLDEAEWQRVDVNVGLRDTLALFDSELSSGVRLDVELDELPAIGCYPGQLNQAFLNVLLNARDAIAGEGTIVVRSRATDEAVVVSIQDDGVGIPAEDLPRVFDPGFTTKGVGVGTGLGLAICFQIMQQHDGEIRVDSRQGEGATFILSISRTLRAPSRS